MSEINLGGTQSTQTNQNNPLEPKVQNKTQQLAQEHNIPEQFIDTEFQVPTDYVELPSQGMFYANRKSSIQIKYLTAEDENILTSADLIKSGKVLDVLLKKAIIDRDIDPEDLLSSDRNAVLIALRITGYGDEYEVKTNCPSCSHANKGNILLSSLQNREVADTPDSEGLFSVQLPKCKANIKFRLLKGSDETRLQKVAELNKKTVGNNMKYKTVLTERYLLQIMEVQGNRDKTFIKKFISAMPIADSLFFREYLKEVEPGLDMNHDFECESCGHNYSQEIPMTAKLFWPNANV